MEAGGPGIPVAEKMTDGRSPADAERVFEPALVPKVQLPTVASPSESVVATSWVRDPPPDATEKTTGVHDTGFPAASVILT
jgi:hypothetical protein